MSEFMDRYLEEAPECDFEAFKTIVESRRSVRKFTDEKIPDRIVEEVLDLGLLAPNSSNLQPWQFYWIRDEQKRKEMIPACLDQNSVKTASTLIVAVARTDNWGAHAKKILEQPELPPISVAYYTKIVPLIYTQGLFGLFGFFKKIGFGVIGLFKAVPRGPFDKAKLETWAHKGVALASENIMLGFRAAGYDSCPMEGFDEVRVKRILELPRSAHVTMVIAAGKRSAEGVYGPRLRLPRDEFIFKV